MDGLIPRTATALQLNHPPLIDKAVEYERLLKLKSGLTGISDVARAAICLDFAANLFNTSFKTESATKIVGIRKKVYINNRKIIGKLLNIEENVNVDSLCVKLNCTEVREVAENLLSKFSNGLPVTDQRYIFVAVHQACKLQKVKIPKSSFLSLSNLTNKTWKELEVNWKTRTKNISTDKITNNISLIQNTKEEPEELNQKNISTNNPEIEDYEVWKQRILKEAFKEVGSPQSIMNEYLCC